jgi:MFS family permease
VLIVGVLAIRKVEVAAPPKVIRQKALLHEIAQSIVEGGRSVFKSTSMRMVMFQNVAMGAFFMGSYIVTLPILIREVYAGDSTDLALLNIINSIGLVSTIFLLLRFGDIHRQGRALLIAQGLGCLMLGSPGYVFGFSWLLVFMFGWGMCGGIAMSMSRTIMQEKAPPDQRRRIMAFIGFSFMGAGPLRPLLSGYLVTRYGPQTALMISSAAMFVTIVFVSVLSKLWQLDSRSDAISTD